MARNKVRGDDHRKRSPLAEHPDPFGGVKSNPFTTDRPTPSKPNITDPRNPPKRRPNERRE